MDGVANMRVHASFNYSNANYAIRLTDIFIVKVGTCIKLERNYLAQFVANLIVFCLTV